MKITDVSIDNRTSVFIFVFIILISGLMSYINMPREAAPDVQIPLVIVSTPYFGVSPEDIESLITQPIEKEINSISEVKEITSSSLEGYSLIRVEFDSGFDIDDALTKVREKVDKAEADLPNDVEKPQIIEINFSEFPIITLNINGPQGLVKLKDIAEDMKDDIENVDGVLEVKLSGGLEREVQVNVDINKIIHYNIRFSDVIDAIANENRTIPGGVIDVNNSSFLVRIPGEFDEPFLIEDLIVKIKDGTPIYLKDVADVDYSFEDQKTYSRLNGTECITLNISKRIGANIIEIADNVKSIIKDYDENQPESVDFAITVDQSKDIKRSVKNLENNIFSGLILVLLVLLGLLGARNATFVALAIPLSMMISFIVLSALDITLNFVVLFSLILALGMLVDNAIVIIENIYKFLEEGYSKIEAAKLGSKEVAWPITTSTLTTLMAFAPLLFWQGVMGDFMKYLPITLIVTLSSSLFVALVINPVLASSFMKVTSNDEHKKNIVNRITTYIDKVLLKKTLELYEKFLSTALGADRNPTQKINKKNIIGIGLVIPHFFISIFLLFVLPTIVAILISFVLGMLIIRMLTNIRLKILSGSVIGLLVLIMTYGAMGHGIEFFPQTDPERITINVESPTGTNIDMSDKIAKVVEERLVPFIGNDVSEVVANVGISNNPFDGGGGGVPNKSTITVQFIDFNERSKSSSITTDEIRDALTNIAGADLEIKKQEQGPPVGSPINIEIVGDDFELLGKLADQIKNEIKNLPGVVDLKDNYDAGRPEVKVIIDREKAALYSMNTTIIANNIRTAINGFEASKYRINEEEYDITVRLKKDQRNSADILRSMRINYNNNKGKTLSVPLIAVAKIEYGKGLSSIQRKDLKRVVTITGNNDEGYNSNEVLDRVKAKLADFELPTDYKIDFTGENEEQAKAMSFLTKAFLIAFMGIFMILVIQFNTFSEPIMIMIAVLISLTGVFIGLLVFALPFGVMMTFIGVISLAGVVVNNNIVLIDYIKLIKSRGLSIRDSIIRAGVRRFRPVVLTAVTTILGLIPLTFGFGFDIYSFSIESGGADTAFWRPMGIAVIFGLLFGTILTLVIVPVMYSTISEIPRIFNSRKDAKKSKTT